jgi:hypothetical protein
MINVEFAKDLNDAEVLFLHDLKINRNEIKTESTLI